MGQGSFRTIRTVALVTALVATLTACWPQRGADNGASFASAWPTAINATNVASLDSAFTASTTGAFATVVSGGSLYAATSDGLRVFDAGGKNGCADTPTTCRPRWSGSIPVPFGDPPVVVGGRVWVIGPSGLVAYDATGGDGCHGDPLVCDPVVTGGPAGHILGAGPDVVFVITTVPATVGVTEWLLVVDTSGHVRWTAKLDTSRFPSLAEVVTDGAHVFARIGADASGPVAAFDLAGVSGCTGFLTVCAPLWTTSETGFTTQVAVRGGRVYSVTGLRVEAFDAAGVTNCSGRPRVCGPVWSAAAQGVAKIAVGADRVIGVSSTWLRAFPLSQQSCGGDLLDCRPLWSITTAPGSETAPPTIAGNVVYVTRDDRLAAYPVDPPASCTGSAALCPPSWQHVFRGFIDPPMIVGDTLFAAGGVLACCSGIEAFRPAA